jgi:zinc finger protein
MAEEEISGETCPLCKKKALILTEKEENIPYFGKVYLFSMTCSNCRFHKSDVESVEQKEPCRCSIEVSCEADMKVRVVKSSQATVKIPHIATITPGPAANGYITNVEGILNRVKGQAETAKSDEEDEEAKNNARKIIKKINRITWGEDKTRLIIEDPSGNSAIISSKAKVEKLKK